MLKNEPKQFSLYSILYNKIPENHILKQINSAVDFSFINDLLKDSYCEYYGRPAKEPVMMVKLLVLKHLYDLSDEKVIEEASLNIAYMWFVGINPEEDLPDASLLTKFRKNRLKEVSIDEIIKQVVVQCIEKGIIKGSKVSIDATHIQANTVKKVPERIMKHLAKKILKNLKQEDNLIHEHINQQIPNYKEIQEPKEAKKVMKDYLESLIQQIKRYHELKENPKTTKAIKEAKEILDSPKFIEQKGIRSLVDKDARVGRKTKTSRFYGYKLEYTMLSDEKIITSAVVNDGAYVDGTDFGTHLENTLSTGLEIQELYADKAFFRKDILKALEEEQIEPYIPVSRSVYKMGDSDFTYNKDSDQWMCSEGNYTIEKRFFSRKNGRKGYSYYFDKKDCGSCINRKKCYKGNRKAKVISVGHNFNLYEKYLEKQKSREYLEKYKSRASIENKNAELKRFHGLDRAKGYGLKSVRTQAKLAILAVNLKRIAKIASSFFIYRFLILIFFTPKPLLLIKSYQKRGRFSVVSNRPKCFITECFKKKAPIKSGHFFCLKFRQIVKVVFL